MNLKHTIAVALLVVAVFAAGVFAFSDESEADAGTAVTVNSVTEFGADGSYDISANKMIFATGGKLVFNQGSTLVIDGSLDITGNGSTIIEMKSGSTVSVFGYSIEVASDTEVALTGSLDVKMELVMTALSLDLEADLSDGGVLKIGDASVTGGQSKEVTASVTISEQGSLDLKASLSIPSVDISMKYDGLEMAVGAKGLAGDIVVSSTGDKVAFGGRSDDGRLLTFDEMACSIKGVYEGSDIDMSYIERGATLVLSMEGNDSISGPFSVVSDGTESTFVYDDTVVKMQTGAMTFSGVLSVSADGAVTIGGSDSVMAGGKMASTTVEMTSASNGGVISKTSMQDIAFGIGIALTQGESPALSFQMEYDVDSVATTVEGDGISMSMESGDVSMGLSMGPEGFLDLNAGMKDAKLSLRQDSVPELAHIDLELSDLGVSVRFGSDGGVSAILTLDGFSGTIDELGSKVAGTGIVLRYSEDADGASETNVAVPTFEADLATLLPYCDSIHIDAAQVGVVVTDGSEDPELSVGSIDVEMALVNGGTASIKGSDIDGTGGHLEYVGIVPEMELELEVSGTATFRESYVSSLTVTDGGWVSGDVYLAEGGEVDLGSGGALSVMSDGVVVHLILSNGKIESGTVEAMDGFGSIPAHTSGVAYTLTSATTAKLDELNGEVRMFLVPDTYTVTAGDSKYQVQYKNTVTLAVPAAPAGCSFGGWFDGLSTHGQTYVLDRPSDVTLVPVWITVDPDYRTERDSAVVDIGSADSVELSYGFLEGLRASMEEDGLKKLVVRNTYGAVTIPRAAIPYEDFKVTITGLEAQTDEVSWAVGSNAAFRAVAEGQGDIIASEISLNVPIPAGSSVDLMSVHAVNGYGRVVGMPLISAVDNGDGTATLTVSSSCSEAEGLNGYYVEAIGSDVPEEPSDDDSDSTMLIIAAAVIVIVVILVAVFLMKRRTV